MSRFSHEKMEVLLMGIDLVKKNGKFFQVVEVLPT
jgi:hypothetical protein